LNGLYLTPGAAGEHSGKHRLRTVHHSEVVGLHHRLKIVRIRGGDRTEDPEAGVVHQDVHVARGGDQPHAVFAARDIGGDCRGLGAERAAGSGDFVEQGQAPCSQNDVCAAPRHLQRGGASDPARGPCDDHSFASQFHHRGAVYRQQSRI